MDIKKLKDGLIFMHYTNIDGEKCAILFPIFDRVIYDYKVDYEEIRPLTKDETEDLREDCEELWFENEHDLDSYDSIDAFLEDFGRDEVGKVESAVDAIVTFNCGKKSQNDKFTFSLLVGKKVVCKKVIKSRCDIKDGVGIIPEGSTKISPAAFEDCTELTSVVIPDSVTRIGEHAFKKCTELTSVVIPSSVTEISTSAFHTCTSLKSINIPNGVKEIGWYAFKNCTGLTSIVIPDSVTDIRGQAFYGCTGLTSIVISNSVTELLEDAFAYCTGLTSIVIPESVEFIDENAFRGCENLTSVTIPANIEIVRSLSDSFMPSTKSLEEIFINCNIIAVGEKIQEDDSEQVSDENHIIFPKCYTGSISGFSYRERPDIETFVVKKGNKRYDSRDNCNAVIETHDNELVVGGSKSVIPNTVTKIREDAFIGRKSLKEIVIPESVKTIGNYAFEGCTGLTSIVIPESVETIGNGVFEDCTGLTSIVIPNSVKSIGRRAFGNCTGLPNIVLPSGLETGRIGRGDGGTFEGCAGLQEVTINSDWLYDYVPDDHFKGPGIHAPFMNCTGITTIHLSPSVKRLTGFTGCKGLKELVIPNTVDCIGNYAFKGCKGLKSIAIPESVMKISDYAFEDCKRLKEVTFLGAVKKMTPGLFQGCNVIKTIKVPAKMAAYYKRRLPENLHSLIVELPAEKKAKK